VSAGLMRGFEQSPSLTLRVRKQHKRNHENH
jgi:hypothetical protein